MKMAPSPGLSAPWTGIDTRRLRAFAPQPVQTPRGRHAQLLTIAAARRLRCIERTGLGRTEDAVYWKAVAPSAVFKAAELRAGDDFAALPC
ncbi:MAG: hypothetical protein Q7T19_10020 [Caulobacter sp.]|nr:hypothetical protein [Caulobacter sp.]